MRNKKFLVGTISAAMVASVIAPISAPADVYAATDIQITKVQVLKAESIKVTYKQSGKTVTTTMKPSTPVKHLSQIVLFKLQGKSYRYKLEKRFQNPNYVSYGRQIAKAKTAIDQEDVETALQATVAAIRHLDLIKLSYMSPSTYEKAQDTILELENSIAELEGSVEETTQAVVQSVQLTAPNTLTITGTNLDQISSNDISINGVSVTSAYANTAGTSMTVQLGSTLAPEKSTTVTIRVNGEAKSFTIRNEIEAKEIAIQSQTYDYQTSNQALKLLVDGTEMSVDTLKSHGYSLMFTSYNHVGNTLDTGLFAGDVSTSTTGILDSNINNNTTFQVMVTITKNGKTLTSKLANIYIKDLNNRTNIKLDAVSGTNLSNDNYLYLGNYVDNSVRYRLNTYGTNNAITGAANVANYRIYSSNTNIARVDTVNGSSSDILVTAVGTGTATISVYDLSNKLITSQTVTVSSANTITNQAQANQVLTNGGTNVSLPLNYSGNLSIYTNAYQNITLTGNITGSVTIYAPYGTVTNTATIGGDVTIQDLSSNGFTNRGTIRGKVNITDTNGVGFSNSGYVTNGVDINTAGAVNLSGNSNYNVVVRTNNHLITKTGTGANVTAAAGIVAYVNNVLITQQSNANGTGVISFATNTLSSKVLPSNFITVTDANANTNASIIETVTVSVVGAQVVLTETGYNTGVFTNASTIDLSSRVDGETINVSYYDLVNANGTAQNVTNTFRLPAMGMMPVSVTSLDTSLTLDANGITPVDDVIIRFSVPGLKTTGLTSADYSVSGLPAGLSLEPTAVGNDIVQFTLRGIAYTALPTSQATAYVTINPSALANPANKTASSSMPITITKKYSTQQAAPNAVGGVQQITNLTPYVTYDYSTNGSSWTRTMANENGAIINLIPGYYYIKVAATTTSAESQPKLVQVTAQ